MQIFFFGSDWRAQKFSVPGGPRRAGRSRSVCRNKFRVLNLIYFIFLAPRPAHPSRCFFHYIPRPLISALLSTSGRSRNKMKNNVDGPESSGINFLALASSAWRSDNNKFNLPLLRWKMLLVGVSTSAQVQQVHRNRFMCGAGALSVLSHNNSELQQNIKSKIFSIWCFKRFKASFHKNIFQVMTCMSFSSPGLCLRSTFRLKKTLNWSRKCFRCEVELCCVLIMETKISKERIPMRRTNFWEEQIQQNVVWADKKKDNEAHQKVFLSTFIWNSLKHEKVSAVESFQLFE